MTQQPSSEEVAKWDRWFAVEMNNHAWSLSETPSLTPSQRDEMLHAAHAAALHWGRVGTELNKARTDMLLAQVHAILGNGSLAMTFARRSHDFFTSRECPDWEIAFVHAVLAYAAYAASEESLHATEYALAKSFGEAIAGSEDREIFNRTFNQLPRPKAAQTPENSPQL